MTEGWRRREQWRGYSYPPWLPDSFIPHCGVPYGTLPHSGAGGGGKGEGIQRSCFLAQSLERDITKRLNPSNHLLPPKDLVVPEAPQPPYRCEDAGLGDFGACWRHGEQRLLF